jgi:hypothetical protein
VALRLTLSWVTRYGGFSVRQVSTNGHWRSEVVEEADRVVALVAVTWWRSITIGLAHIYVERSKVKRPARGAKVCPPLPGHGFSGEPTELGWEPGRIADARAELMDRLG